MAGIRVSGVSKSYPQPDGTERLVLSDIDLFIQDGEFVCLLGPSGCGKTTLLNILSGLDRDYDGRVGFMSAAADEPQGDVGRTGEAVERSPALAPSRKVEEGRPREPRLSYMFQESRLLPWMTVRENLRFVLDADQRGARGRARIDDWLERVQLADSGNHYPAQLSVGMQQRAALARALIIQPEVLFMDEPLSSLDELTATFMRDELLSLWAEQRATVVFVTHNPLEAVYLADRVLIMAAGPGRIISELRVNRELPRPRNAEDTRLWELSRRAVRILKSPGRPEAEEPVDS